MKLNRNKALAMIASFIILTTGIGVGVWSLGSPSTITISPESMLKNSSFNVGFDGTNYYSINGSTGELLIRNTNACKVLTFSSGNLTAGGSIFIGAGTYWLSQTWIITTAVTVAGTGPATILKLDNGANVNCIQTSAKCAFRDFAVDGNRLTQTSGVLYGFYIYEGSDGTEISNVDVKSIYGGGTIIRASHCKVFGGYYTDNRDEDVEISSSGSYNIVNSVTANSSCTGHTRPSFWFTTNAANNIFSNCISQSCWMGFGAWNNNGYISDGNTFAGCKAVSPISDGFWLFTTNVAVVNYTKIQGCTVNGSGGYGVNIADSGVLNAEVSGCTFTGCASGAILDAGVNTQRWGNVGSGAGLEDIASYSYIIYVGGSNYFMKNGTTGLIDYSSTNASRVFFNAYGNLSALGGGLVHVLRGTYTLTNWISPCENSTTVGDGWSTILRLGTGADTNLIRFTGVHANNIVIRDLALDGNMAGQSAPSWRDMRSGIYSGNYSGYQVGTVTNNIRLENLYIHDIYCGAAIRLVMSDNIVIQDVKAENNGFSSTYMSDAVFVGNSTNVRITNLEATNCLDTAIALCNVQHSMVVGTNAINCGAGIAIVNEYPSTGVNASLLSNYNTIVGGLVQNCSWGNVGVNVNSYTAPPELPDHTTITGIHLLNNTYNVLNLGEHTILTGSTLGTSAPIIVGTKGVWIRGGTMSITGNTINDADVGIETVYTTYQLEVSGNTFNPATLNHILNLTGSVTDLDIHGNNGLVYPSDQIGTASFIVSTDGTYYYATNCTSGQVLYSSTNVTLVEQFALGNMTVGQLYLKEIAHNTSLTLTATQNIFEQHQGVFKYWNSTTFYLFGTGGATGPTGPSGTLFGLPFAYLIFHNSTSTYAVNGTTGAIDYNNATDDTGVFQYCADHIYYGYDGGEWNGGIIYVVQNEYNLYSTLLLNRTYNLKIIGLSGASPNGKATILHSRLTNSSSTGLIRIIDGQGVEISNFKLQGNGEPYGIGIERSALSGSRAADGDFFSNLYFAGFRTGMWFYRQFGGSMGGIVEKCEFDCQAYGTNSWTDTSGIYIQDLCAWTFRNCRWLMGPADGNGGAFGIRIEDGPNTQSGRLNFEACQWNDGANGSSLVFINCSEINELNIIGGNMEYGYSPAANQSAIHIRQASVRCLINVYGTCFFGKGGTNMTDLVIDAGSNIAVTLVNPYNFNGKLDATGAAKVSCIGNPQGFATTTPAFPTTGVTVQNNNTYTVRIIMLTVGTTTAYTITDPSGTSQSITTTLFAGMEITLDSAAKISFTFSAAPTWKWYGQ